MLCHHDIDEYVNAYLTHRWIRALQEADLVPDSQGQGMAAVHAADEPADVYRMVGRRAAAASVHTKIGCHSFRATGITEYLRNGGKLEVAQ